MDENLEVKYVMNSCSTKAIDGRHIPRPKKKTDVKVTKLQPHWLLSFRAAETPSSNISPPAVVDGEVGPGWGRSLSKEYTFRRQLIMGWKLKGIARDCR